MRASALLKGSVNVVALLFVILTGSIVFAQQPMPLQPLTSTNNIAMQQQMARQQAIQNQMNNLQNQFNQQRANMAAAQQAQQDNFMKQNQQMQENYNNQMRQLQSQMGR